jgi:L-ascorbate metabolism protein UlaG (beta-lactamase superfamily)
MMFRIFILFCVALPAFSQTTSRISRIQRTAAREIIISLSGTGNEVYRYEISTNLTLWEPFYTFTNSAAAANFTDVGAPYKETRFYRAVGISRTNLTGDHLITDDGVVTFHAVYHASFVIQWKNLFIYVDPTSGAGPYTGIPRADLVVVSHEHGDHFSASTIAAITNQNTRIIAPQAVYTAMTTALRNITTILTNNQSTALLSINIEATPAYNYSNSNHPLGRGNGYVLTIGGRRIYVSGDTEDVAEMRALRNIDAAFVAMNVPYTMSTDKAASAMQQIAPRMVFPYHYRNIGGTYADLNLFKTQLGTNTATEVRPRVWY